MKKFLILLACVMFAACLNQTAFSAEETVVVISYAGDVKVVPAGEVKPLACRPGMLLSEGTRIITGEESYVEIAFDKPRSNIVKVKENSEVVLKLNDSDKVELIDGKVFVLLRDLKRGSAFRVRTPCAVCGARGTGWGVITDSKITDVAVFEAKVFVRGLKKDGSAMDEEYWIERGFERKVKKFESPGELLKISDERLAEMEAEFGLDTGRKKSRENKFKGFGKNNTMREEQMESILERKDDARLDKMREKRSSGGKR